MPRMKKACDDATMDNIVLLREKGLSIEQTSVFCKVGHATCARVYAAYNAAKNKDYDALRPIAEKSGNIAEWACKRFGLNPLVFANEQENAAIEPEKPAEPEKPDNTATAFATLVESIKALTSAVDAIDKRLSAMQLTQQGFRGDMSVKISQVVEAVHVEGDILTKEHERMIELLSSIKTNTKRRSDA